MILIAIPGWAKTKALIQLITITSTNVALPAVVVPHCVRCCTVEVDPAAGVGGALAADTELGVAALALGTSLHQNCP